MPFWPNWTPHLLLAICLMSFVSGCSKFDEPVETRPPIPDLAPEVRAECPDPGVDRDARKALIETRLALAECRRRNRLVVSQYDAVQTAFGAQ